MIAEVTSGGFDFGKELVGVLLSVILMFNVGAYSFLWYKIRRVEEEAEKNTDMRNTLAQRLFGMKEDETMDGYIIETEENFERIHDKLDDICDMIEEESKTREENFDEFEDRFDRLCIKLYREEGVDIDGGILFSEDRKV